MAEWLEGDGVDLSRLPTVIHHRNRMSDRPLSARQSRKSADSILARRRLTPARLVFVRRKCSKGVAGVGIALTVLTGCSQLVATGSQISASVVSSYRPALTGSPEISGPVDGGNATLASPRVVGAGSFPRSFLIPGTDTSIRIGG
jgi:hypothetical protein